MKAIFKIMANLLARLAVAPLVGLYAISARLSDSASALTGPAQLMALAPGKIGAYLRCGFYRGVLHGVGNNAFIGFGSLLTSPRTSLGTNAYIGPYCVLGEVAIGENVLIASGVSIINGPALHGIEAVDIPIREQPGRFTPIAIGADCWIGERAVVMASLGRGCVVGAGAVVTRPLPDYAVAVGVPARIIRYRDQSWQSVPNEPVASAYATAVDRN